MKRSKYGPYRGGKKQSREKVSVETQMLDIADKKYESATTNMFKELMKTMSKELIYKNDASGHMDAQSIECLTSAEVMISWV